MVDPVSGLMGTVESPVSLHGTGVVVDSVLENGRREYLILTNDHVADPSRYFDMSGRFIRALEADSQAVSMPGEVFVVDSWLDGWAADDVRLVPVAHSGRADAVLLKTVNAPRPMTVFTGEVGYPAAGVPVHGRVITSGYPYGGRRSTAEGTLVTLDHRHALGTPHTDFSVDLPLQPGQSGSPVFLVTESEPDGDGPEFRLIALLHAREKEKHLAVPYAAWARLLDPTIPVPRAPVAIVPSLWP